MNFTALDILHTFRTMSNGGAFLIKDETFYSVSKYTFEETAKGNIKSVTFKESGLMPPSKDAMGNERAQLKASVIDAVEASARAAKVADIDDKRLDVELKKVTNELATL